MTPLKQLEADVSRCKALISAQLRKDRDNIVALEMYQADLFRAQRAIEALKEEGELSKLRGIVRGERVETA